MNGGLIGGVVGSIIGVLGGVVGTYCSIKNTRGPREKAFMIRCSVIVCVSVMLFLSFLFYLPKPYAYLLWIPYVLVMSLGIPYVNRKQLKIRAEEERGK